MRKAKSHGLPPSLTTVIYGFVGITALLAASSGWYVINKRLDDFQQSALAAAVTVRAQGVQLDLSRTIYQEWLNARTIANDISRRDPTSVRSALDLIVGENGIVSWAGIATPDGTVSLASDGLLEGKNVSQRPWFQRGLGEDYAGDVHEAVLLAQLLPNDTNEPRRFLDLATPIQSGDNVDGVLGLHLNYNWVQNHLRETAEALGLDVFVVNRSGDIVMASHAMPQASLDLPSMRAAETGASVTGVETWPDGERYLTAVIPQITYKDLPSFGWSLVARIPNDSIVARPISSSLLIFLMGFGVLLAALTFLFSQLFARPFHKIAQSAGKIMRGETEYPYESHTTAEAQTLSASVARLQSLEINS